MKKFVDVAYLIDMHERRLSQYAELYQQFLDKLTHLLFLYSAMAIFLMPMTQDILAAGKQVHWMYVTSYAAFMVLLAGSVINAVGLMAPGESLLLKSPAPYVKIKTEGEKFGISPIMIDMFIKETYLNELSYAVERGKMIVERKQKFHNRMYRLGLMAIAPHIICLLFYTISHA